MFDVGGGELLLIFVAVLLLFGPKKIPEVMRSVGKGLRQFRQAQEDLKQQMRDLSADVEKMTAAEEPIKVETKPIVPEKLDVKQVPSTEIEVQLPNESENTQSGISQPVQSQPVQSQPVESQPVQSQPVQTQQNFTPKPAESTIARNPHTIKKVYDDTVNDD